MQKLWKMLIAITLLAVPLAGCASDAPTAEDDGTEDDVDDEPAEMVYTHLTIGEPDTLDPAIDYETSGGAILQNTYETLVFYDGESTTDLVGVLATEVPEPEANGTVYTFTLREGVTFHTGGTMTADDVKFSLDRLVLINDPDSPSWIYSPIEGADAYFGSDQGLADRQAYLEAGGVEVVDEHTVRVTLDFPDPAFLYRMAFTAASIISEEAACENANPAWIAATSGMDCIPPPGTFEDPWLREHIAGTGPFELVRWEADQFVELKRFEEYWGERPALTKFFFKKVEDINTRLLEIESGNVQSIYVPQDQDTQVMGKSSLKITEDPSWTVSFIGLNLQFCGGAEDPGFATCMAQNSDAVPKDANGLPAPDLFADINMRKAWTHAFDYETYFNDIANGHGRMLNGPLPQGIFGYDDSIPQPEQDLEAARAFFEDSAYAEGFAVTIFYNSGNTVREKTAALLAQNVEALAPDKIEVNTQVLDWSSAFLPKQRAKALPVFYLGWAPDYGFPDNYVVTFAHSERGVYAKRLSYENTELNTLLDQAIRETDRGELERLYGEATRMLNDDAAFIWLGQLGDLFVSRQNVEGHYYNPMYAGHPGPGDYSTLRVT